MPDFEFKTGMRVMLISVKEIEETARTHPRLPVATHLKIGDVGEIVSLVYGTVEVRFKDCTVQIYPSMLEWVPTGCEKEAMNGYRDI
jgi:hypothetical protein